MDKSQRLRWAILLSVLAVTIAAIFFPMDEAVTPLPTLARPSSVKREENQPAIVPSEPTRDWLATEDNPFAPRGWIAAAPPSPAPLRTVAPVALAEAPAPVAAPLPFRFLGRMSDGDDRVIYLGQGELALAAREGDVLDGHYKVVLIDAGQIEFEDTTSGLRQLLPFPVQDK